MGVNALGPLNSFCSAIDCLIKEGEIQSLKGHPQGGVKPKTKSTNRKPSKARVHRSPPGKPENKNDDELSKFTTEQAASNVKESDGTNRKSKSLRQKTKVYESRLFPSSHKG